MSKGIKKLSAGYILVAMGNSLFNSTFVLMMSSQKGFSEVQTSLIVSLTAILILPTYIIWGIIIDKNKKLIGVAKLCLLITIILTAALILIDNFYLFFLAFLIKSIFVQPYATVLNEYAAQKANEANIAMGKIFGMGSLGWGLAGLVGLFFMDYLGVEGMMALSCIVLLVQYFNLFAFKEYVPSTETKEKVDLVNNLKVIVKNKEFMWFTLLFVGLMSTMMAAVGYGIPSLLIRLDTPPQIITLVPFLMVTVEVILIRRVEKFGFFRKKYLALMIAGLVLLTRWLIITFISNYWIILASILLHGVHQAIMMPLITSNVLTMIGERQRSTAFLLVAVLQAVLAAIINFLTGQMLPILGNGTYGILYGTISAFCLVLVYSRLNKDKEIVS